MNHVHKTDLKVFRLINYKIRSTVKPQLVNISIIFFLWWDNFFFSYPEIFFRRIRLFFLYILSLLILWILKNCWETSISSCCYMSSSHNTALEPWKGTRRSKDTLLITIIIIIRISNHRFVEWFFIGWRFWRCPKPDKRDLEARETTSREFRPIFPWSRKPVCI